LGAFVSSSLVGSDFVLIYKGGDDVDNPTSPNLNGPRETIATITCDPGAGVLSDFKYKDAADNQPDHKQGETWVYKINARSSLICGGAGGFSAGWVILVVILLLIVVYFIGGIIYNKAVKHNEGIQVVPHVDFWKDTPSLAKDGVMFIVNGIRNKTSSGGYQAV